MTLPAGWTARRPTLDDVPALLAVVHAADTFAIGHPDFDADDVRAALTAPFFDPQHDSWLLTDPDQQVVGWTRWTTRPGWAANTWTSSSIRSARWRCGPCCSTGCCDRVAERAAERGRPALTARCAVCAPETCWAAS